MRILMKDDRLFSLAGLYDTWTDPDGKKLSTCTIITTEPNCLMEDIHNRMPVILRLEDEAEWLGRDNNDVHHCLDYLSHIKPQKCELTRCQRKSGMCGTTMRN